MMMSSFLSGNFNFFQGDVVVDAVDDNDDDDAVDDVDDDCC